MKYVLTTAALLLAGAAQAGGAVPVPEIDALSGVAALALIGAATAFARERSKR